MDTPEPNLRVVIKDATVSGDERLPGQRHAAMFDRAEALVHRACAEPVMWERADGSFHEIALLEVLKIDYEPGPDGVSLQVTVSRRALEAEIQSQASQAIARLRRRWGVRLKVGLARLAGVDIDEADRQNTQRAAEGMRVLVSQWILNVIGTRLSHVLEGDLGPATATPPV